MNGLKTLGTVVVIVGAVAVGFGAYDVTVQALDKLVPSDVENENETLGQFAMKELGKGAIGTMVGAEVAAFVAKTILG